MDKNDIIGVLDLIGTMLEIKGENPFKVRAYFSGSRTLQTLEEDLGTVIEEGAARKYTRNWKSTD
jgi:DNA polymerase (family 10)